MAVVPKTFASLRADDLISDTADGPVRSVMSVEPPYRRIVNITTYDADLNRIAFENRLRPDGVVFLHTSDK